MLKMGGGRRVGGVGLGIGLGIGENGLGPTSFCCSQGPLSCSAAASKLTPAVNGASPSLQLAQGVS